MYTVTQARGFSGRRLCCRLLFLLFPLEQLLLLFSTFLLLKVLLDFRFKLLLLAPDFLQLCFPLCLQIWILKRQINNMLSRNTNVESSPVMFRERNQLFHDSCSVWSLKPFQKEKRANLSLQDQLLPFVDLLLLVKVRRLEPLQDRHKMLISELQTN